MGLLSSFFLNKSDAQTRGIKLLRIVNYVSIAANLR